MSILLYNSIGIICLFPYFGICCKIYFNSLMGKKNKKKNEINPVIFYNIASFSHFSYWWMVSLDYWDQTVTGQIKCCQIICIGHIYIYKLKCQKIRDACLNNVLFISLKNESYTKVWSLWSAIIIVQEYIPRSILGLTINYIHQQGLSLGGFKVCGTTY